MSVESNAPVPSPATAADPANSGNGAASKEQLARRLAAELGISPEELMARILPAPAPAPPPPAATPAPAAPVPSPVPVARAPLPAAPASAAAEAAGLRKGVVVRRVLVPVKPGQEPPLEVRAAQAAQAARVAAAIAAAAAARPKRKSWHRPSPARIRASIRALQEATPPEERSIQSTWRFVRSVPFWCLSITMHLLFVWLAMHLVWATKIIGEKVFQVTMRPPMTEFAFHEPGIPGGGLTDGNALAKTDANDTGAPGDPKDVATGVETDIPPAAAPASTEEDKPAAKADSVIGVGSSGGTGGEGTGIPSAIQGRGGEGKGGLLKKYGGSEASEQAVIRGLRWLSKHQETSGQWSAVHWDRHCPTNDHCGGVAEEEYTSGLTGLCLLCYLGAGHTHKDGEFADNVRRALNYLRRLQTPEGLFDEPLRRNTYNHAICALAVSEAFALTQNAELGRMAQQSITYLVRAQQPGGGWDYTDFQTDRNDMSITGWCIMALKSARMAGLTVPMDTWDKARQLVIHASTSDGRVKYADKAPHIGRLGDGLTAVGLACRFYMGIDDKSTIDRAVRHLLENLPLWRKLKTSSTDTTFYYWYYGTLALFQRGGQDWERWNDSMRDMLIRNQRKDGHAEGSWDPDDAWIGPYAGRLYSTTLNILNLEVYYRYLPLYLAEQTESHAGGEAGKGRAGQTDPLAVSELTKDKPRSPEELLLELQTKDTLTRWKAARALADQGNLKAVPILLEMIPAMDATSKAMFLEVLARFNAPECVEFIAGYLDDTNARVREAALNGLRKMSGQSNEGEVRAWLKTRGKQK